MRALQILVAILLVLGSEAVLPQPKSVSLTGGHLQLTSVPTVSGTNLPFDTQYYLNKVVDRKINHLVGKDESSSVPIRVLMSDLKKEEYHLEVAAAEITLKVGSYQGYIYGLETLFQQIDKDGKVPLGLTIDEPILPHRGIMLDTVRHFISVKSIKRILSTMAMTKLNIFHWHLFDNQAFPFQSSTNPELQSAAYHKQSSYSKQDIEELIRFAELNGVQIIPEIESPGHVRSWAENSIWKSKNIAIKCDSLNSQIDVSKEAAYSLFANVTFEINSLFRKSEYIHMGGNGVNESCWKNNANIKTFMLLHNFKTVEQLQLYWQKELRKDVGIDKKIIYWRSTAPELTLQEGVIIQYNGKQSEIGLLANKTKNKVILSPSDILDLSTARGTEKGDVDPLKRKYSTANQIYTKFQAFPMEIDASRILGGEVTLWTTISNEDTLDNDLWMRAAAFAERVWSSTISDTATFVRKMVALSKELQAAGVEFSPFVSQYCEVYPETCFPPTTSIQKEANLVPELVTQ